MLNAPVMEANDAVSGSMAECYVTIDGNRYNMMQLYSFESSAKVNSQDVKSSAVPASARSQPAGPARGRARRTLTRACSAAGS